MAAQLVKANRDKKLPFDMEAINSIETPKRVVLKAAMWIPDRTKPLVLKQMPQATQLAQS